MRSLRGGFTLIEVLVSVMIMSVSLYYILQIYGERFNDVSYVTKRADAVMQDTFFLTAQNLERYDKSTKSAYDIVKSIVRPKNDEARRTLKTIKRTVSTENPIPIYLGGDNEAIVATRRTFYLKGSYTNRYDRLKIRLNIFK